MAEHGTGRVLNRGVRNAGPRREGGPTAIVAVQVAAVQAVGALRGLDRVVDRAGAEPDLLVLGVRQVEPVPIHPAHVRRGPRRGRVPHSAVYAEGQALVVVLLVHAGREADLLELLWQVAWRAFSRA